MCSSTCTIASEELFTHSHPSSATSSPPTASIPTPRRLRSLTRIFSPRTKMKKRPLQKGSAQKRSLATLKSPAPPQKRSRSSDDSPSGGGRSSDRRESTEAAPQIRRSQSPQERRTNSRPGSSQIARHTRRDGRGESAARAQSPQHTDNATPTHDQDQTAAHPQFTSEEMLEMLKASEKRVMKHVVSQQRVLLAQIASLEDILQDLPTSIAALKRELKDVKIMVLSQNVGNGTSLQRPSGRSEGRARPRNQTKDAVLQEEVVGANPTLPSELKMVFATGIASEAAVKTLAEYISKFHRTIDTVTMTSRCMSIFVYGFQREMKKKAAKDGIGLRHAEFRFQIALTMLQRAKALPDNLFSVQNIDDIEHGPEVSTTKPSWLTSDLVNLNAMTHARKLQECLKSELPSDPSTPEKKKALFIATKLTKHVSGMLRYSRERFRVRMFDDGIYCLLNWEGFTWFPKNLQNPYLSFLWPEHDVVAASTIPETIVGDVDNVATANSELLKRLIAERKEMIVEVMYDVNLKRTVVKEGRKKEEVYATKPMRRIINILRIANSFLCGFCHCSEQDVLRTHPAMLQCLYRFALVIREMFIARIDGGCGNSGNAGRSDTGNETENSAGRNGSRGESATSRVNAEDGIDGTEDDADNGENMPTAGNDEEGGLSHRVERRNGVPGRRTLTRKYLSLR